MSFKRWCGALAFLCIGSVVAADEDKCWEELAALRSDTSATKKVNKLLECAEKQSIQLNNLRSSIEGAAQNRLVAEQARDVAISAVADIATTVNELNKITVILQTLNNPWVKDERTLKDIVRMVDDQRQNNTPIINREFSKFEFAIFRNGGFRELTFSDWNEGTRIMTDSYIRGDGGTDANPNDYFALGGSFWIFNTKDPSDNCEGDTLRHYYYEYQSNGVRLRSGNNCSKEGAVYKRNRLFQLDTE